MAIIVPPGGARSAPSPVSNDRRFHRADPQSYALQQARDRSTEMLYRRGEYAMFVLMWKVYDFEAGRVGRCTVCVEPYGADVKAAFGGQPAEDKCPSCFGTGFEGGYKAKIVRPSLWTYATSEDEEQTISQRRGVDERMAMMVQSTFDFSLNTGDYIFKADASRWFARAPRAAPMSTGFSTLTDGGASIGYNYSKVDKEMPTAVAYLIPPSAGELIDILNRPGHGMEDFSDVEEIKPGAVLV